MVGRLSLPGDHVLFTPRPQLRSWNSVSLFLLQRRIQERIDGEKVHCYITNDHCPHCASCNGRISLTQENLGWTKRTQSGREHDRHMKGRDYLGHVYDGRSGTDTGNQYSHKYAIIMQISPRVEITLVDPECSGINASRDSWISRNFPSTECLGSSTSSHRRKLEIPYIGFYY